MEEDRPPGKMRALGPSVTAFLLVALPFMRSFPQVVPSQAYNQGNSFFQEGEYKKAIQAYRKALSLGVRNSYLYYNLGNAYYKDGQLGRAIWAYEKARILSPRDDDINFNLKLLRSFIEDKSSASSSRGVMKFFSQLPQFFALRELAWGETILYLFLTISLIGYLLSFKPGLRRTMRHLSTVFASLFFVSTLLLFARYYELNFKQRAIILSSQLEARSGPGDEYTKILTLHEGIEVEIKESREGWCLIKLPNGLGGWVERSSLLKI